MAEIKHGRTPETEAAVRSRLVDSFKTRIGVAWIEDGAEKLGVTRPTLSNVRRGATRNGRLLGLPPHAVLKFQELMGRLVRPDEAALLAVPAKRAKLLPRLQQIYAASTAVKPDTLPKVPPKSERPRIIDKVKIALGVTTLSAIVDRIDSDSNPFAGLGTGTSDLSESTLEALQRRVGKKIHPSELLALTKERWHNQLYPKLLRIYSEAPAAEAVELPPFEPAEAEVERRDLFRRICRAAGCPDIAALSRLPGVCEAQSLGKVRDGTLNLRPPVARALFTAARGEISPQEMAALVGIRGRAFALSEMRSAAPNIGRIAKKEREFQGKPGSRWWAFMFVLRQKTIGWNIERLAAVVREAVGIMELVKHGNAHLKLGQLRRLLRFDRGIPVDVAVILGNPNPKERAKLLGALAPRLRRPRMEI